jgi:lactoylglutathione lyase
MHVNPVKRPVINHIAVYVVDLEKSTAFYRDILCLEMIPEPFKRGMHSWFQISENCQLHLIAGATELIPHNINNHISFSTSSLDDFKQHLVNAGILFFNANEEEGKVHLRPDGIRQIFFQDPDGYWLEINDER